MECLVTKLLSRGDTVSIEQGRLIIKPASGKPVPVEWLTESTPDICRAILKASGLDAFEYIGYHTGHYGKHKAPGVTLQFVSVVTGEAAYAIFNVDLTRHRTTASGKAGSTLPVGQFRAGERSHFYKFWISTGLKTPDSMQRFYKRMGKLSGILFVGTLANDRFDAQSIQPLNIASERVRMAVLGHKEGISRAQGGHKEDISEGHNETATSHAPQGLQPFPTACVSNHGKTVISKQGNKVSPINPLTPRKAPQEQTVDEWLADYESA